jgi:8-oxo-dGTP diphosphatase
MLFSSDQIVPASEKPKKSITVVCACIMRRGGQEVLLSIRNAPGVTGLHGKWELPGGKIEFGETPEHAVIREIREELGIDISPIRLLPYLHTNLWEYEHAVQHVVLACYESETDEDIPVALAENAKWFHVNEIDFRSTLPGTREFVSLAAEKRWFDKVYIEFETLDRDDGFSKRFTVATQPTLYSRYALVKYWGRLGMAPRTKIEEFATLTELDEHIFETVKRRLAGGYHIRTLRGPDDSAEVLGRIRELARQISEYSNVSSSIKLEPPAS